MHSHSKSKTITSNVLGCEILIDMKTSYLVDPVIFKSNDYLSVLIADTNHFGSMLTFILTK